MYIYIYTYLFIHSYMHVCAGIICNSSSVGLAGRPTRRQELRLGIKFERFPTCNVSQQWSRSCPKEGNVSIPFLVFEHREPDMGHRTPRPSDSFAIVVSLLDGLGCGRILSAVSNDVFAHGPLRRSGEANKTSVLGDRSEEVRTRAESPGRTPLPKTPSKTTVGLEGRVDPNPS